MLEFFLLYALKTAFQMRHLTHGLTQLGYFFSKNKDTCFEGEASPSHNTIFYLRA